MRKLNLVRFLMLIMSLIPRRYKLKSSTPLIQPFFVFGSGRNGSTLINMMLNQHSKLFLPPEQYFLGNSIIKYKLYNFILWRDLVKVIYGELLNIGDSHNWNFSVNEVMIKAFHLEGEERSLQNLLDLLYKSYALKTKKTDVIWGDSVPNNYPYAKEIFNCFPNGKYIFLIRDGRDVCAAYKKGGKIAFSELSEIEHSSVYWLNSIKKYYWLKKRTNVLLVKYEDLVSDPNETLKTILSFLQLELESKVFEYYKHVPQFEGYLEEQHSNLHKSIFTTSIGQWHTLLSVKEKECLENKLRKQLDLFGYD